MRFSVCLGLGSNLGNRKQHLQAGIAGLERVLDEAKVSPLYLTSPQDYLDQDDFLNCALHGFWNSNLLKLLEICQQFEAERGRDRINQPPKGPRSLDIDILWVEGLEFESGRLLLPHPALKSRAFALVPMLDLLPAALDPRDGRRLLDCMDGLRAQGVYSVPW